jgi:competence protein ComEC
MTYPALAASTVILKIKEGPKASSASNRYVAEIFMTGQRMVDCKRNSYLYLKKTDHTVLQPGDILLALNAPDKLKKNNNPGAFDFFTYSIQNGIGYSMWLDGPSSYTIIGPNVKRGKDWMILIREKTLTIIRKYIKDRQNAGLAEAMLIGFREDLDKELLNAYTNTGVVHIIAISGLHLGLIFMLMDLMIRTIAGRKKAVLAGFFISLPLLWIFAVLTGSSASVIRSAIMFSFLIIGKAIGRKSNGMNSLLGSAFMLLLWKPDIRFDLGFQLSYAAVASILLFDREIKQMVFLQNKTALYLWSMVSITLAAQVLTTPIVIANFHRFPTLFLFTNLVAVPLSSLVLIMEIILCMMHRFDAMANGWGTAINALIHLMNDYVLMMGKIPFGMIERIELSNTMLLLLSLFFSVWYFLFRSPARFVFLCLVLMGLALPMVHLIQKMHHSNTREIHVLNLFGATAIVHQHGHHATLIASASLLDNKQKTKALLDQTGIALGIDRWDVQSIPDLPAIVRTKQTMETGPWILLSHGKPIFLNSLQDQTDKQSLIIADASTPVWKIKQWEKESQKLHLRFKSIPEEGPFTIRCHQTQ